GRRSACVPLARALHRAPFSSPGGPFGGARTVSHQREEPNGRGSQEDEDAEEVAASGQGLRQEGVLRGGLQAPLPRQELLLLPLQEVAPGRAAPLALPHLLQGGLPHQGAQGRPVREALRRDLQEGGRGGGLAPSRLASPGASCSADLLILRTGGAS